MCERRKLDEAKYFYSRMVKEQSNRDNFSYNLSAFLSSARSVLQYAFSELKENKGKKWYDSYVSASPILRFFKNKRNINIHTEPVSPVKNTHLTSKDTVDISDLVLIIHRDKNGNIIQQHSNEFHSKAESTKGHVVRQVEYKFSDWKGNESVLVLCQKYLQELERLIENGVTKGFITG